MNSGTGNVFNQTNNQQGANAESSSISTVPYNNELVTRSEEDSLILSVTVSSPDMPLGIQGLKREYEQDTIPNYGLEFLYPYMLNLVSK